MSELKRTLGIFGAASMSIGSIAGIGIVLISIFGDIRWIASVSNFGNLIVYILINLSLLQLRKKIPDANRTFKVPFYPVPPILGIMSCIILLFFLNRNAVIFGVTWILIGLIIYHINQKMNADKKKNMTMKQSLKQ